MHRSTCFKRGLHTKTRRTARSGRHVMPIKRERSRKTSCVFFLNGAVRTPTRFCLILRDTSIRSSTAARSSSTRVRAAALPSLPSFGIALTTCVVDVERARFGQNQRSQNHITRSVTWQMRGRRKPPRASDAEILGNETPITYQYKYKTP